MLISAPSNCPLATEKVLYIYIYIEKGVDPNIKGQRIQGSGPKGSFAGFGKSMCSHVFFLSQVLAFGAHWFVLRRMF